MNQQKHLLQEPVLTRSLSSPSKKDLMRVYKELSDKDKEQFSREKIKEALKLRKTIKEKLKKSSQELKKRKPRLFDERLKGNLRTKFMDKNELENLGITSFDFDCDSCLVPRSSIMVIEKKSRTIRWGLRKLSRL